MWEDIKWWIVLIITIISFLVLPGLLQMLWEEIKNLMEEKNK
tara:strand:- start:1793 stop:1918 length:126 start_codon:yes stop_codon:yes gene_type:complete